MSTSCLTQVLPATCSAPKVEASGEDWVLEHQLNGVLLRKCKTPVTAFPERTLCIKEASKQETAVALLPKGLGAFLGISSEGLPWTADWNVCHIRFFSSEPQLEVPKSSETSTDPTDSLKVSNMRHASKLCHGTNSYADVKSANADSPLHASYQRLTNLFALFIQEIRSV